MRAWRTSLTVTAIASAVLLTAGTTAASGVAAARSAGGTARASVPWGRVGVGWVLAQYTSAPAGPGARSGPEALYLISPGGTRYELASWPNDRTAPVLAAWSPDGKRALFEVVSDQGEVEQGRAEQLTLATGQLSTFVLQGAAATPIGYTTPDGLNIVAYRPLATGGNGLARYTLSGRLASPLGYSANGEVLYAPAGTEFVTGASDGLKLVSNSGKLLRPLPIPGTAANLCNVVRWWDSGTVLASCSPPDSGTSQVWLVPLSGRPPTALTPLRNPKTGDNGDFDAWSLPSGLYLQSAGACGVLQIFKQAPNGSITLVTVPHTEGDNHVKTALGSRLLIEAPTSCEGSISLLWFDPGTRAEQWLVRTPATVAGVVVAIPFYSRENGDL
jgi:hypothetical protein